jgi:hypothetical protein
VGRAFLEAYAAADRPALEEVTTPEFYKSCLVAADLQRVPLPVVDLAVTPFECRQHDDRTDLLFELDGVTCTLNLSQSAAAESGAVPLRPRVEEVTLYERDAGQIKRLSIVFLAQAVVEVYAEALADRDAPHLRQLSTTEFNAHVWDRFSAEVLEEVPMPEIQDAPPEHLSTVFQGAVTEVTVMQGDRALTYVLHAGPQGPLVHDVLMPVLNRPSSLSRHIELLAPIHQFAQGFAAGDRDVLLAASANGLDRIVWDVVDEIPDVGVDIVDALSAPVESMQFGERQSTVRLSHGGQTAEVQLVLERGRFVVEDIVFQNTPGATGLAMLQAMRQTIAREMQARNARRVVPVQAVDEATQAARVLSPL